MSQKELKEFLKEYGDTDIGKHVKEQLDIPPDEDEIKAPAPRSRLSVTLILFKTMIVVVGLVVLMVRPVIGLLLFILAACISKWKRE